MKKVGLKLIAGTLLSVLVFASFLGIKSNNSKKYRAGDYIASENAYYVGEVTDSVGYTKAEKFVAPSDTYYSAQKARSHSITMLGDIESVWDSYTGKGTTIAVIDDGFDYNHPEYTRSDGSSAILSTSKYFYVSGSSVLSKNYSTEPSCIAEDWALQSDNKTYAWNTHGTNTSTTAAAPINGIGGVGIAPEADILAIKTDMQFVSISYAIQYAVNQGVDVINMSLGAYADSFTDVYGTAHTGTAALETYLNDLCTWAYNQGIIVVAAAGNHATYHKSYPACNSYVIGVGALGKNAPTTFATFTNYNGSNQTGEVNVDILAPGYVYTAGLSGDQGSPSHSYFETQGTSFSSPIVAAAACLWKQKYPNGTPAEFLSQLQSTASDIGAYTNNNIQTNVGPSNITQGRLNVGNLLAVDSPYVSLKKSSYSLSTGETEQIQLDTYNGDISYSSSNTSVATVTNAGLIRGVGSGSATITVTATKNGNTFPVSASVTVSSGIAPTSISFNPASISLEIGDTYNAEETIVTVPSNASRLFLYESDDESVFTVDDEGIITAVGAGDAELMVLGENNTEAYLSVSVAAQEGPTSWEKVSTISDGDYLIVYETGGLAFNGGLTTLDAASNTISVSISNDKIPYNSTTEAAKFTITTMTGGYSIKAANGKYISGTSGSNVLNQGTTAVANTISISNGDADIVSNTSHLRYNTSTNQFRYYKSSSYTSQKAIQLYKLTSGGEPVPTVSGVTVSPSSLSLDVYNNKTGVLTATVNGTNSPSQAVNWDTGNSSVATVSNGTVTAVGAGTTTITATSVADGTKSGSCTVTVTDSTPVTLSSISVKTAPTKLSYEVGDNFDPTGLVITRHYSNNSESDYTYANHTSEFSFDPDLSTALTTSDTSVTITYGGVSTTQSITVTSSGGGGGDVESTSVTYTAQTTSSATITSGTAPSGSSVTFSNTYTNAQQMTKDKRQTWTWSGYSGYTITSIKANMKRNSSSGTGTLSLTNNSVSVSLGKSISYTSDLTSSYAEYEFLSSSFKCNGNMVLTITSTQNSIYCSYITLTYEKKDTSDKVLNSLTASYSGGNIYVGDNLDTSKVSVTANFTDSSKYPAETLTSSDYSLSTLDSSTAGNKTITVTYTGSITTLTPTVTTTFNVTVVADTVSNVSVSNTKTYHPGETIVKSDITVTLSWASGRVDTTTTDFSFANDGYQFTYSDAPSGGTTGSKQFSITFGNNSYNFSVNVSRVSYTPIVGATDTLTRATTGVTGGSTSYSSWSGKIGTSGAVYAGQSAGGNDSIQLRSNNSNSGVIMTTSGGRVTKVSVVWQASTQSDRVLNIYGKNSAYSAPTDLYDSSKQGTLLGTITCGTSTELTINGDYTFIGIRSNSGAAYLTSITIQFGGGSENPTNVSNYIMYEDTVDQCKTKLSAALEKLNSMSNDDKSTFMTSNDYVIATARERITAWAKHEGKTFSLTNNTFVVNSASVSPIVSSVTNNSTLTIVIIFTTMSLISIGGYFFIRRKHE